MATKTTSRKTASKPKTEANAVETAEKASVAPERVNPYKDYPLDIPLLLRTILCELWELRNGNHVK